MDIAPGSDITIEITKPPTREAARKTLHRVLRKDPVLAKRYRVQKENRPSWQEKIRGGRWWHHQMKSTPKSKLEPGATYQLRATVDVIRDLSSVAEFIKVTAK